MLIANKYDLTKYKKSINNNDNLCLCSICMDNDTNSSYIKLDCAHIFHSKCIKEHVRCKINNTNSKICCPYTNCNKQINNDFIFQILDADNDLIIQHIKNELLNDTNCSICVRCEKTYCYKYNNTYCNYCSECNSTHCFQCGLPHSEGTCFEHNKEQKEIVDTYYAKSGIELKTCPHCGIPQEKLSGCSSVICGANYHSVDKTFNIQGCGKQFNWNNATKYIINKQINTQPNDQIMKVILFIFSFIIFLLIRLCVIDVIKIYNVETYHLVNDALIVNTSITNIQTKYYKNRFHNILTISDGKIINHEFHEYSECEVKYTLLYYNNITCDFTDYEYFTKPTECEYITQLLLNKSIGIIVNDANYNMCANKTTKHYTKIQKFVLLSVLLSVFCIIPVLFVCMPFIYS